MLKYVLSLAALLTIAQAGVVAPAALPLPYAAAAVAPFATSYNAHVIAHSVAAPYAAAAPLAVAPAAYAAAPFAYPAAAYTVL